MAQNWFKHDYGARNDADLLELRAECGWKGYGLFYAIIETMAENEKGAIDLDKIGGLSIGFGLPKDEILAFVETCLKIGIFYTDEDGMIRNSRITAHVEKMKSFQEAGKKGAQKRWSNDSDRGANRGANGPPNAGAYADKSRVDKSRLEERANTDKDINSLKASNVEKKEQDSEKKEAGAIFPEKPSLYFYKLGRRLKKIIPEEVLKNVGNEVLESDLKTFHDTLESDGIEEPRAFIIAKARTADWTGLYWDDFPEILFESETKPQNQWMK